jgi:hypothetical protein
MSVSLNSFLLLSRSICRSLLTRHILSLRRVKDAADQASPEDVHRCRHFLMAGARAGQAVHECLEPLIEAHILKSPLYGDLV